MPVNRPDLGEEMTKAGLDEGVQQAVKAEVEHRDGWEGMVVMKDLPMLSKHGKRQALVLRQHTLDVNDAVLQHLTLPVGADDRVPGGPAVLITGSPGIGKSVSFLPAVVRGLVRGKAGPAPPVIFIESRPNVVVYKLEFSVDPVTGVATDVTKAVELGLVEFVERYEPALRDPSTVYIVDPTSKLGVRNGSPGDLAARTVVIASPNSDHFKDFMKRTPSPLHVRLKQWSLEDAIAARLFINDTVSVKELVTRWRQQGGNPRVLFDTYRYEDAVKRTKTKVKTMSPGVLSRIYESPADENLDEGSNDEPNSAVVTYIKSEPPFRSPTIGFISDEVGRMVEAQHTATLLALISRCPPEQRTSYGLAFEGITARLVGKGGPFRVLALPGRLGRARCGIAAVPHRFSLGTDAGRVFWSARGGIACDCCRSALMLQSVPSLAGVVAMAAAACACMISVTAKGGQKALNSKSPVPGSKTPASAKVDQERPKKRKGACCMLCRGIWCKRDPMARLVCLHGCVVCAAAVSVVPLARSVCVMRVVCVGCG